MRWFVTMLLIGWISARLTVDSQAQMIDPEDFLTRNTLLLVEVPDAQTIITKAKANWYDHWYLEG